MKRGETPVDGRLCRHVKRAGNTSASCFLGRADQDLNGTEFDGVQGLGLDVQRSRCKLF